MTCQTRPAQKMGQSLTKNGLCKGLTRLNCVTHFHLNILVVFLPLKIETKIEGKCPKCVSFHTYPLWLFLFSLIIFFCTSYRDLKILLTTGKKENVGWGGVGDGARQVGVWDETPKEKNFWFFCNFITFIVLLLISQKISWHERKTRCPYPRNLPSTFEIGYFRGSVSFSHQKWGWNFYFHNTRKHLMKKG